MTTQDQRVEYLRRTEVARERFTPASARGWEGDALTDVFIAVDLVAQTIETEARKNPVEQRPGFLWEPPGSRYIFGQTMHDVGKAVMDALIKAGWTPASRTTAPATSRTVVCRSDCAEIPGYCSSGIGCLGSAPSSPSTPEEPA